MIIAPVALALSGCCPNPSYPYDREPNPRKTGYIIGSTDLLKVSVWKDKDLTTRTRVRPDGKITFPLIGELRASGLTVVELRDKIQKKLGQFIQGAESPVSVTVLQPASYKITVVGKVARPGSFQPKDFVTVMDVLAMAGGVTRFADGCHIAIIRRRKDGTQEKIPFVYPKVENGERLDMNITLLGGDIVSVP